MTWSNSEPDVDIVTSCKCTSSTQCHVDEKVSNAFFDAINDDYDASMISQSKSIDTKKTIYVLSPKIYLVGLFHIVIHITRSNWLIFFVVVKWFLNIYYFFSFIQNERCIKPFIDTCDFDNDGSLSTRGKD